MRSVFVLLCLAVASAFGAKGPPSTRPNVLVILSDDQAWGDYGFMGHPHIDTPALDKLAAESLTFSRGYTPVPLCRPALATIATGLYPHAHGVTGNDPDLPDPNVNPQVARPDPKFTRYFQTIIDNFSSRPNFIRQLTSDGYRTLQTGKWWEGDPKVSAGFTEAMTIGTGQSDRHGGAGLAIGREGLEPITDFIGASGDQPWMVWYAPFLPHAPHTPPAELLNKYLKIAPTEAVARYWACVEWFDQTCAELFTYLDRQGLREETIIIYTTDNGWIQNPDVIDRFAPRSKQSPYEGGVRTPIIVNWPGQVDSHFDRTHLASNIDLWPTIAALTGTKIPVNLPGINLTDPRAVSDRRTIHGEASAHNIADVDHPSRSLKYRWMIEGWLKIVAPDSRNLPQDSVELFDLKEDPNETHNLAAKDPKRVAALLKKLDEWWTVPVSQN